MSNTSFEKYGLSQFSLFVLIYPKLINKLPRYLNNGNIRQYTFFHLFDHLIHVASP
jgi:hypothetical protein